MDLPSSSFSGRANFGCSPGSVGKKKGAFSGAFGGATGLLRFCRRRKKKRKEKRSFFARKEEPRFHPALIRSKFKRVCQRERGREENVMRDPSSWEAVVCCVESVLIGWLTKKDSSVSGE